jgi:hypothetical protein
VAAVLAAPPHPAAGGGRHAVGVEVAVAGGVQLGGEIGPQDRERPPALNAVAGGGVAVGPPLGRQVGGQLAGPNAAPGVRGQRRTHAGGDRRHTSHQPERLAVLLERPAVHAV